MLLSVDCVIPLKILEAVDVAEYIAFLHEQSSKMRRAHGLRLLSITTTRRYLCIKGSDFLLKRLTLIS